MSSTSAQHYSPGEERLNIASHLLGLLLSLAALPLMLVRSIPTEDALKTVSALVFGASLIMLYSASSLYHSATESQRRQRLRVFDHCAIFVLIAGSYTPFTLVTLSGSTGWAVFAIVWSLAAIGIGLKLFFTGRFKVFSTGIYVLMGWLIVFVSNTLMESLPPGGFDWLLGGGIVYSVGAILYSIKALPFNHAIFHLFVVAGSACHFIAVYSYVLPVSLP